MTVETLANPISSFDYVGPFCDGRAVVRVGNKWGYIKENNHEPITEIIYKKASNFINGFAQVDKEISRGFVKCIFIDKDGNECNYDDEEER